MEKEIFVIELPLKVEKWQEDLLDKRYELLRTIYNYAQNKLLKQFEYFEQMSEWKKCENKKDKSDFLKNHPFYFKGISSKITFSEYDIVSFVQKIVKKQVSANKTYKDFGINTSIAKGVGKSIWAAWNKKLYEIKIKTDKKTNEKIEIPHNIHFKEKGDINTMSIMKSSGYFGGLDIDLEHMILSFNTNGKLGKNAKKITLPIVFDKPTEYEMYSLKNGVDSIRVVKIVRKLIRGKYKFYVQFTIEGEKPQKNRKLGKGEVGIDIGPSTVAVSSVNGVQINILAERCDKIHEKCKLLGKKMDSSRRANNPENYNDNGTVKESEDGNLKWNDSKRYIKLRNKKRELQRKQAAIRKVSHNIDTNNLLELGNVFIVENNNYSAWQHRAKETKINKNGKFQSKKRFGKSIANHAPALFITILENKVKSLGGKFFKVDTKNAATRFDFTDGSFTKHNLREREITLSNGNTHHRDLLSAFNLQHLNYNSETLKDYNVDEMKKDYSVFCKLEKMEVERFANEHKNLQP